MMELERDYEIDCDDLVDNRYDPERQYEERETAQRVTEVFALLRNVVVLHVLEEKTLAEVAVTLRVRRSTVERAWRLARATLAEFI